MKFFLLFILAISVFLQTACGPLKYKKVSAKDYPPEPEKRIQKNMEEGKGFRVMGNINNRGGTFDFASSNPLWIATLDTLDFMPLVSANYSGGIIITDWYGENNSPDESIKISVRFLTNEIRSDALDVNIFIKQCTQNLTSCSINQKNDDLVNELKLNILKKASLIEKNLINKNKKKNPYVYNKPSKKKKK